MEKRVGSYVGPVTKRGAYEYFSEWKASGLGSIDSILAKQFIGAGRRKTVKLLDIGSGRDAHMLKDLLFDPSVLPETRYFMRHNPGAHLELMGMTDAQSQDEFNKPWVTFSSAEADFSARMQIIPYTLTATQPLSVCLDSFGVKSINTVTAVWSLAYMGPNVFEQVLSDALLRLDRKNGVFIGVGYSEAVAGLGFDVNFNFYPDLIYPRQRISNLTQSDWSYLLTGSGSVMNEPQEKKLDELQKFLPKILRVLTSSIYLTKEESLDIQTSLSESDSMEVLSGATSSLRDPLYRFSKDFFDMLKEKKDDKIRSLAAAMTNYELNTDYRNFVAFTPRA